MTHYDKILFGDKMITSLDNPKIKYLQKLSQAKNRKKEARFVVEGKHLVEEARKLDLLIEAYSIDDIPNYTQISKAVMEKICNTDTVISEIGLCKMLSDDKISNKVLILDAIQDPGNMGTLMRSAVAFGFNTIVLGEGCVDIYNPKVIRSSQGAIFKLNFLNKNLLEFLPTISKYKIYGTDVVNGVELDNIIAYKNIAIVLGNEGNGISKEVKNLIKENIYIPMFNTESLNVSVAGSIIMYKLRG